MNTEREKLIEALDQQGAIVKDVDGYYYLCMHVSCVFWPAHHLLWVAEELDKRNEHWNEQVTERFSKLPHDAIDP